METIMGIVKVSLAGIVTFIIMHSTFVDAADVQNEIVQTKIERNDVVIDVLDDVEDYHKVDENIQGAWQEYCAAKNAMIAGMRSESYEKAIYNINEAVVNGGNKPEVLLLASRIYRGKGGVSYAKNYFSKASAIYLEDVFRYPESIEANLKAAILLYAGDVRYWETYNESRKKAEAFADKVFDLYKTEKIKKFKNRRDKNFQDKNREQMLEEAVALSFLVKENFMAAERHFARASKLCERENINAMGANVVSNKFGKNNYGIVKIVFNEDSEEAQATGDYTNYLPYILFKKFTKQGKWYWPVTKQTEANKEFLLNCLTGFYL